MILHKVLRSIRNIFVDPFAVIAFSQEGEDLILARIFNEKREGFYVDIGAHHPKRFSNTYLFYLQGWKGINVDAAPGSMDLFKDIRPRDINVECAVALSSDQIPFYIFNEPALNTFDKDLAQSRQNDTYKMIKTVNLIPKRLETILDEFLTPHTHIDFLSIDVEGKDLEVLQSNNWTRYRPLYVLVESMAEENVHALTERSIYRFLTSNQYEFFCNTMNTLFFKDAQERNIT